MKNRSVSVKAYMEAYTVQVSAKVALPMATLHRDYKRTVQQQVPVHEFSNALIGLQTYVIKRRGPWLVVEGVVLAKDRSENDRLAIQARASRENIQDPPPPTEPTYA